ncbi:MAG: hypothetical protein EAZ91_00965 [Cytophagales bacterium]|nr:MAG: hypothetical protein EAZ91_00965 [Cytophagales bacterium]
MNTIEQTIESINGAIHVDMHVPAEWEGYVLKVTVERTEAKVEKPKRTGLSRFRGKWAHLPLEDRLRMQKELDNMRNEWERPIS